MTGRANIYLAALLLVTATGCGREVGVELDHQPPVASLAGPTTVERGKPATYTVTARAREGSLRPHAFEFHLLNEEMQRRVVTTASSVTHTFTEAGLHVVSVVVTDDSWATARASVPVQVLAAKADDKLPPTVQLEVTGGGAVLGDGAGVSFGDTLALKLTASDDDNPIGQMSVTARDATGAQVALDQPSTYKPTGDLKTVEHTFKLVVPQVAGALQVQASATDTASPPNQSQLLARSFTVSAKDTDGDGLPDDQETGGCTDPSVFNGLELEVWPLSPFPKALCWVTPRPAAENILNVTNTAAAAFTTKVTGGFLQLSKQGPIGTAVLGLGAAPAAVGSLDSSFALRYSGKLCVPSNAATLEVESKTGDDVLVLLVDDKAVAANDIGMGCTTFYQWLKLSYLGSTASIDVSGRSSVEVGVLVASEAGAYGWNVAIRFLDATGAEISVTLDQRMFQAP